MTAPQRGGAAPERAAPAATTERARSFSRVSAGRDAWSEGVDAKLHDLDQELGALGFIIDKIAHHEDPGAFIRRLDETLFTGDRLAVFGAVAELLARGEAIDADLIAALAGVESEFVKNIALGTASGARGFLGAVRNLRDFAARRQMVAIGAGLVSDARDLGSAVSEMRERALQSLGDPIISRSDEEPASRSIAEVMAELHEMPAPRFLVRGVIAAGDYGVLGAERKAGKTFAALDLAVAVASGGKWLGRYQIDTPGPVLFSGPEGGPRKFVRRLRAIAECYGVDLEELPIHLEFRSRELTDRRGLDAFAREIGRVRPVLVIVDSFYRSAPADNIKDLSVRGAILQRLQEAVAESSDATLAITHHWNKTGAGGGIDRLSGTGFGEWARFIVSMAQIGNPKPGGDAIVEFSFDGDEIPHSAQRFLRTVTVDDPSDLASAMHYQMRLAADIEQTEHPELAPAHRTVLAILERSPDAWLLRSEIQEATAQGGFPLKDRTVQNALKELEQLGLARSKGTLGASGLRWQATACAFDAHSDDEAAANEF